MKPTLEYIKRKFGEYNRLCFDGKLEMIPVRLSNARTFLGKVSFVRKRDLFGNRKCHNFSMTFSCSRDIPEELLEDTILHEMIHYWILSNGMQDTSAHGRIFRSKMEEINSRFNRNITITHKVTKEEQDNDTERRRHLVCVTKLRSGKCGVTVAARSRLFRLWDEMAKFPDIAEQEWILTTDPYFNRFPRALTAKLYLISPTDLKDHLAGHRPLERHGNTIRIKTN